MTALVSVQVVSSTTTNSVSEGQLNYWRVPREQAASLPIRPPLSVFNRGSPGWTTTLRLATQVVVETSLTSHIDLDLQLFLGGDLERRTLGDYSALDRFGNDRRFTTEATLARRRGVGWPFRVVGGLKEIVDQHQPVKDEKDAEVVQDDREGGGILGRSEREKWRGWLIPMVLLEDWPIP